MKPVLSLDQSKKLDCELIRSLSLSSSELIDNAGRMASRIIDSELGRESSLLFLIGPGNNGSDGLVAAEALASSGHHISVYLYHHEKANDDNQRRCEKIPEYAELCNELPDECHYDAVVEALFGFSFHGQLDDSLISFLLNADKVYALDSPAGFSYSAYKTITFTLPKKEFYFGNRDSAGIIEVVNPGFPDYELSKCHTSLHLLSSADFSHRDMPLTSYKNTRGHVALLSGSDSYIGASILASKALFKAGAGLVSLYSSDTVVRAAIYAEPGIIAGHKDSFSSYNAILAGPGWGNGHSAQLDLALESGIPTVIDADGLKLLNGRRLGGQTVITPHVGEFRTLIAQYGIDGGLTDSNIKALARASGAISVVKSSVVYISDGKDVYIYDGENPALGVAGSGDILSAVIAAGLGRGEEPLKAAINGVIMHQSAGRALAGKKGFFTAGELLEEIGRTCYRYIFSL